MNRKARNKIAILCLFFTFSANADWIPNYITNNIPFLETNIIQIKIFKKESTNNISILELKPGDDILVLFSVKYTPRIEEGKFYGSNLVGYQPMIIPRVPLAPKIKNDN